MAELRAQWHDAVRELNPGNLWFLDETGARTNMVPLYARSFDGGRVVDKTPCGRWQTTTLVGALGPGGVGACMVLEGPIDALSFQAYVENFLCPLLRPGDVVIMDNLSSHQSVQVKQAVQAREAKVLFLPPYSPDLNPIEKMWSKIKQYLKKAKARTYETLLQAIAEALGTITSDDAQGWFRSCGYAN